MDALHTENVTNSAIEHPIEVIQRSKKNDEEARRLQQIRATMGWAAAADRAMTMQILANTGRMGGLPSSRASLRHFTGQNTRFEFEDFLGLQQNKAQVQPLPLAFFESEFDGTKLTLPTGQNPK